MPRPKKPNGEGPRTEYYRAYYQANKERVREQKRAYRAANREKVNAYAREYQKTYRGGHYQRDWYQANKQAAKVAEALGLPIAEARKLCAEKKSDN